MHSTDNGKRYILMDDVAQRFALEIKSLFFLHVKVIEIILHQQKLFFLES